MPDLHAERRDRLRSLLRKRSLQALLVTDPVNVRYLTGFSGDDSYLLIERSRAALLSDFRFITQLAEECPDVEAIIRPSGRTMPDAVCRTLRESKLRGLGIEADSMRVALRDRIASRLAGLELTATSGLVESLRMIKDAGEVAAIRQAVYQAEKAFAVVRAGLHPEQTEKELADALDRQMRTFGAVAAAFPSIVAMGERAALPHATPGGRRLGQSEFVLIDWGADGGPYKSDLTRVLVTGKISPKLKKIYGVVLNAQRAAIDEVRPGIPAGQVDRVAREAIAKAGFGRYFGHSLGHGLGMQVHEGPRVGVKQPTVLKAGMVVTIEPGIYLPGWGGVRIEDDVLVTRSGREVLTSAAKDWEQAIVGNR